MRCTGVADGPALEDDGASPAVGADHIGSRGLCDVDELGRRSEAVGILEPIGAGSHVDAPIEPSGQVSDHVGSAVPSVQPVARHDEPAQAWTGGEVDVFDLPSVTSPL